MHRDDRTHYRWWSDVNSYRNLDGQTSFGPAYLYEYSTRQAYGSGITWGANDPLNATWWHHVTERTSYPFYTSLSDSFFRLQRWKRIRVSYRCENSRISELRFNQLMFLFFFYRDRHSPISRASSPSVRPHATAHVPKRRYAICVVAHRVSPCRIVKVALGQFSLEHFNISSQFLGYVLVMAFKAGPSLCQCCTIVISIWLVSLSPCIVVRTVLGQCSDLNTLV